MILVTTKNERIELGKKIKAGGEGAVYFTPSQPRSVVKIYHIEKRPNREKLSKLQTLITLATPQLTKIAAWPLSFVHENSSSNPPIGLILPFFEGQEIHNLYSPLSRKTHFPAAKWDFLIHVARNIAAAFDTIHSHSIVMGDVNEGNFLVGKNALIGLLDCDSYQITTAGKTYLCEVGIPMWTPPELQGRSFKGLKREVHHDCFGLAVMIFYLLFMGKHPFAGIPQGIGDVTLEQAIGTRLYPYSRRNPSRNFLPPLHSLSLETVHTEMGQLFERAFLPNSHEAHTRPSAKEWLTELTKLEQLLQKCHRDDSHQFLKALSSCPWCQVRQNGGPNFFITASVSGEVFYIIDLSRCGLLFSQIKTKNLATIKLPEEMSFPGIVSNVNAVTFPPSPPKPKQPPLNVDAVLIGFLATLSFLSSAYFVYSDAMEIGMTAFLVGVAIYWASSKQRQRQAAVQDDYRKRKRAFDEFQLFIRGEKRGLELSSQKLVGELAETDSCLLRLSAELESAAKNYRQRFRKFQIDGEMSYKMACEIPNIAEKEKRKLEEKKRQRQLEEYLDKQLIRDAKIQKITTYKKQILEQYGIESAYDIRPDMRVPGFGDVLKSYLLAWRASCEQSFRFLPGKPLPAEDIHAFNLWAKKNQEDAEHQLFGILKSLDRVNSDLLTEGTRLQSQWRTLLQTKAQLLLNKSVIDGNLQKAKTALSVYSLN